ncbi:Gfo/Idh/MocA family protein [Marinivivus vitaminiproducens]|uniref:Gfo/Idh/MocA family protein n=1 Tax=Marinivivus vitaminiproducens TaxID=3035935 RepID=UPI00279EA4C5|nr:Gfo/Idh/MocA family oxidoreductase [Geminicoccaceae bacterium SCSIO 64248]
MADERAVPIGIIGCGTISAAYLKAASLFPSLRVVALADRDEAVAARKAEEFGLTAMPVDALLGDPAIEIVVNLTVPKAHVEVGQACLAAGKHVYSEKPLGVAFAEAQPLIAQADALGLRVGCAPDTFLGGAHQTCRRLIDEGAIGTPVGGTAFFMCPGHERWHPNPAFYYERGGGPMLDMGPYYITDLVNLLGPVAEVSAMTSTPRTERVIGSEPRRGQRVPVEVPTHVAGTLRFVSGAVVVVAMSFDVPGHHHRPLEIYGTEGALVVPDPNRFGGEILRMATGGEWQPVATDMPYADGNYRSLGVADMACGLRAGRPHRASGALALHVLEVMEAFGRSSSEGRHVALETRPERPAPLRDDLVDGRLA